MATTALDFMKLKAQINELLELGGLAPLPESTNEQNLHETLDLMIQIHEGEQEGQDGTLSASVLDDGLGMVGMSNQRFIYKRDRRGRLVLMNNPQFRKGGKPAARRPSDAACRLAARAFRQ